MKVPALFNPEKLGPAMEALTDRQRNYVVALVEQGGSRAPLAYMKATGCTLESAQANYWRMNTPAVYAAIREEADKRLRAGALLGASVLVEIAEDSMHKDRFKAAARLLDQAGLIVATEHKVTVEDKRSTGEITKAIMNLAKQAGVDPRTLLGDSAELIEDAVFVEVEPESSEGLEDIL